jgi:hypothetical protein
MFGQMNRINSNELQGLDTSERVQKILRNIKGSVVAKVLDISEFSTKFNTARFLRVFIYHAVFWYFGPLNVLLISIFDSFELSKNMGFWFGTSDKRSLVFQFIISFSTIFMVIMQLLKKYDKKNHHIPGIYIEQVLFYSLHMIIRSFIIAVRYGSCSELRFTLLRDGTQSSLFLGKDLLGRGWL